MSKEEKDIFGGWDSVEDMDFFGEETKEEDVTNIIVKDSATNKEGDTKIKDEDDEDETIETSFFDGNLEEEEEEEEEEVSKTVNKTDKKKEGESPTKITNIAALETLKKKGLVEYELEEGEELTEELAEELLEEGYENAIESKIGQMISGLPQEVKDLIKFATDGGDVKELFAKMSSNTEISEETDMDNEVNQIMVIKDQLRADGHDEEYISDNIEFLKDSGKLQTTSKKIFAKKLKNISKDREDLVEGQKQQKIALRARQKEFKKELKDTLIDSTDIKSLRFNRKDKNDLPDYIAEATVMLENGNSVTQMQRDLQLALQDKEKVLLLAKLLKDDFNFGSIVTDTKTKEIKRIKNNIQHSRKDTPENKIKRSLADFL